MILSTSDTNLKNDLIPKRSSNGSSMDNEFAPNMRKGTLIFLGISLFCLIIFLIYDQFSHNVRSPYMTWLFCWPLLLGALPSFILWIFKFLPRPGYITINLFCSGIAALTVGSLLRGIFDIAGTASPLQTGLSIAGIAMVILGFMGYGAGIVFRHQRKSVKQS